MIISEENRRIADHYGYEAQSNHLIEECAELIQAINKYRRAMSIKVKSPASTQIRETTYNNIVEEIADVEVMLEQIKYLLRIPEDRLAVIKRYKIDRTESRIRAEETPVTVGE